MGASVLFGNKQWLIISSCCARTYSVAFDSFEPTLQFCPFCLGFLNHLPSPATFIRLTRVNEEERVANDECDEPSPDEDWDDDTGQGGVENGSYKEQG